MAILQSYYQDVYRSPVVRLSGYSGRHGLASSILAYLAAANKMQAHFETHKQEG